MHQLSKQQGARAQFAYLNRILFDRDYEGGEYAWRQVDKIVAHQGMTLFDYEDVIRNGSKYHARFVQDALRPWPQRHGNVGDCIDAMLAKRVEHRGDITWSEILEAVAGTDSAAHAAQKAAMLDGLFSDTFMAFTFPVGDFLILSDRQANAHRRAIAAVVAAREYEAEHGKLPNALDELVDHGMLSREPVDPFAMTAFGYDPDRRMIWSVGADGVDDGGQEPDPNQAEDESIYFRGTEIPPTPTDRFDGKDYVWRIAELPE